MADTPEDFTTLLSPLPPPGLQPPEAAAAAGAAAGAAGNGGNSSAAGGGGFGAGGDWSRGASAGGARSRAGATSPFPIVRCRNVFLLPGVPHLLQRKWPRVRAELEGMAALSPFGNR